jgi:hypothetical protein
MRIKQLSRVIIVAMVIVIGTPLSASSTNVWSTPVNLSGWQLMEFFRFISGPDGINEVSGVNTCTFLLSSSDLIRLF